MFKSNKAKGHPAGRARIDPDVPSTSHTAHNHQSSHHDPDENNPDENPVPSLLPGVKTTIDGVRAPDKLKDLTVKVEEAEVKDSKFLRCLKTRPPKSPTEKQINDINLKLETLKKYKRLRLNIDPDDGGVAEVAALVNNSKIPATIRLALQTAEAAHNLKPKVQDNQTKADLDAVETVCTIFADSLREQIDRIVTDMRLVYHHDIKEIKRENFIITYTLLKKK